MPEPKTSSQEISDYRVLLMVNKGANYRLEQIYVSGVTCHIFFIKLRETYFRLRGFLRNWLSIWRYSHCDFYMASIQRPFAPSL